MKNLVFAVITIAIVGCHPKNEFDVSSDQIKHHVAVAPHGKPFDLDHLPASAVKHVKVFHKGDVLPDGSIAKGDAKMVTVDIEKSAGGDSGDKQMKILTSP